MHHCLLEEKSHQHILFLIPDFSDSTLCSQTQILGDIHENENHSVALKKKKVIFNGENPLKAFGNQMGTTSQSCYNSASPT